MADPITKRLIAIRVIDGTAADYVTINNKTKGWKKRLKLNASGEATYNPYDDDKVVANGDSIIAYLNGRLRGGGTATISAGGISLEITGTADTSSQAVNL